MRSPIRKLAVLLCSVLAVFAQLPDAKRLSIYTSQTGFSLSVVDRNGKEYVGLLESLEPMGTVNATLDGKKWKLTFNGIEGQFEQEKNRAKIGGNNVDLGAQFLIENGRGLVPVTSLPAVVEQFTSIKTNWHQAARRLFVGATPIRYNAQLQKGATTRLALNFSAPVNPTIATEGSTVRLVFNRDAVVSSGNDALAFEDSAMSSVTYSETNGAAQIVIRGSVPLFPTFADGNRTVAINTPSTATVSPTQPARPVTAGAPPHPASASTTPPTTQKPSFLVLIDPAHGGDDRGVGLTTKLAEKDFSLTLARRLRAELEAKGITARLLRDSDTTIAAEQRAIAANASGASLAIVLHTVNTGTGVHLATSPLASTSSHGASPPWASAQSLAVGTSRELSQAIASELLKRDIPALQLKAAVSPINSFVAPVVVVEIAPPAGGRVDDITGPTYLPAIMNSIISGITKVRPSLSRSTQP